MPWKVRSGSWLALPVVTALLVSQSCTGDAFQSEPTPSAGQANGGERAEAGQGSSGDSAEASAGGAAGAAGAANGACSCDAGQFCRDGACVSCLELSDPSSLEYGPAEPFEVINDTIGQEGLRLPRRPPDGIGLVYVRDFFGGVLWYTPNPSQSAGAPLSKTDVFESGGLPTAQPLPDPLAGLDFFFSRRARIGAEPLRTRLFGAHLQEDGTLSAEQELPAPFNSETVVSSHGLALGGSRALWTRNVDGGLRLQLVTTPLPPSGEATELRLPLPEGCGFASELDFAPWLTPDGQTLFFSARRVDEGCPPPAGAVSHLYVLALSSAGQPLASATALTGLAEPGVRQTDPSLSPDGCELLFSAQEPEGPLQLFHAPRVR
ncbi:MAG: hypothetical protein EOO73_08125 [Myxococcales bacterium]|nr:MAG: hypothetical protein EOO73_08125 [Myxococcales bacterium]